MLRQHALESSQRLDLETLSSVPGFPATRLPASQPFDGETAGEPHGKADDCQHDAARVAGHRYASSNSEVESAATLAFGAFLNVCDTCRSGGQSIPQGGHGR